MKMYIYIQLWTLLLVLMNQGCLLAVCSILSDAHLDVTAKLLIELQVLVILHSTTMTTSINARAR
jgi:hypothetical protein